MPKCTNEQTNEIRWRNGHRKSVPRSRALALTIAATKKWTELADRQTDKKSERKRYLLCAPPPTACGERAYFEEVFQVQESFGCGHKRTLVWTLRSTGAHTHTFLVLMTVVHRMLFKCNRTCSQWQRLVSSFLNLAVTGWRDRMLTIRFTAAQAL